LKKYKSVAAVRLKIKIISQINKVAKDWTAKIKEFFNNHMRKVQKI
jgi:hypothetical protein